MLIDNLAYYFLKVTTIDAATKFQSRVCAGVVEMDVDIKKPSSRLI